MFLAYNNFNVLVETFFACFRQFYFLTQTEYFALSMDSLCIVAILAFFKMLSFFEYKLFFGAVFCIEQLLCVC